MRTTSHTKRVILALFVCLPVVARAEGLYLTGAEVARNANYVYLGRLASINQEKVQPGPAYRLWFDQTKYQYNASGTTYKATAYGIEAGIGSLFNLSSTLSGSAFASLVYRDTVLSPVDLTNAATGPHTSIKLQGDINYRFAERWMSVFNTSYIALNQAYWGRLRVMRESSPPVAAGLEYIKQGDATYSIDQLGLVVTGPQAAGVGITLKAGARQVRGEGSSPYVGIELGALY